VWAPLRPLSSANRSERDRSLERRFQAVKVPPPSEDEAIKVFSAACVSYESFSSGALHRRTLEAAVRQSTRYIPDRFLPDKAIDVIDEAGRPGKLRCGPSRVILMR
jgi:ATP-dependent Clp protease ATP-binding subunit ClpC